MKPRISRAIAVAMAAGLASIAAVAGGDELSSRLKLPVSPASIALLAPYAHDPAVVARWKAALTDPNPDVRGVAARGITTSGVADLLADVEAALKKETDPNAAREEAQALILLGREGADPIVFDAANRFDGALDPSLVRAIARARGLAALPLYFQKLGSMRIGSGDRAAFFRLATRGDDSLLGAASMALGRQDLAAWKAILVDARHDPTLAGSPIIRTALGSEAPVFQSEAAWYLAKEYCDSPPVDREQLIGILDQSAKAAQPSTDDPEIAFGVEMLRRVLGEPAVENKDWIACLRTNPYCHLDSDLDFSPLRRYLTEGEREAIDARNVKNAPHDLVSVLEEKKRSAVAAMKAEQPRMWMMGSIPHGLGADFRKSTKCGDPGLAEIGYRPDGRPGKVTLLVGMPIKGACFEDYKSLFLLSLAPPGEPTTVDKPWITETSLDEGLFSCDESTSGKFADRGDAVAVRGRIEPPKLEKRVEPVYPEYALWAKLHGVTVLEAIITSSGCVNSVRLLKSSALPLDAVAMKAVSQWTYKPATLDGRTVSVDLTVTVNFQFRR